MLSFTDSMPARERVIVALDCDKQRALELAGLLEGHAAWLKVGMTLYYAEGPGIVSALKDRGFKVFLDLKLHDIPHQVQGAAASAVRSGADMLTIHASGGAAMLAAAREGAASAAADAGLPDPVLLGITVLTSMDAATLSSVGVVRPVEEQVAALAALAQGAGLDGVVASPKEAAMLRAQLGPAAYIVTPGVRPAGASLGDQSRVATPQAAIQAGSSHLVVGRPITQATDPAAAFDAIAEEVSGA